MRTLTIALLALPLASYGAAAFAGDAAAGKAKAETCMDCHAGEDFEGMALEEIIEANRAVVSGAQRHPPGIEEITEADIEDVSAYFYAEAGGE
jgi:cytochrome c